MADDQDPDSKTEDPSQKRLADAREKGQVPKSQEFNHVFMLAAILASVMLILPFSFSRIVAGIVPFIERPHSFLMDHGNLGTILFALSMEIGIALVMPFVLFMIAALLASIIQVGWMFTTEKVFKFEIQRFDPVTNLKQKFSLSNLVEFLKSLGKIAVVGIVVTILLLPLWNTAEHFIQTPIEVVVKETQELAALFIFAVLMVVLVIAIADYAYQRFEFMKKMRMTKQEVKDEFKQTEGDPLVKGKIRQLRYERARSRMMAAVPQADVVVTNPTHYSVALKYDPQSMAAPMVLAKGVDAVALRIREVAKEHDIPVIANPPLARALYATAELNKEVPVEHFKAVAQVISYVFKLKGRSFG